MLSQEEKLLVDRYLDNTLTGIELSDFLNRLENDFAFKTHVSFHNKLIEGLCEAEDYRLIQYSMDAIGYKKTLVPFSLKLIITFLIITGIGITLWEYIGPNSTGEKHNYFTWRFRDKSKVHNEVVEKSVSPSIEIKEKVVPEQTEKISEENLPAVDSITDDIVVRKDQLLISYNLQPIELATDSRTNEAIEKSDPEAGLPEKQQRYYEVEFWVSPVNYRGYKLQGEKLILFGIEVPDEVQLYSIESKLWLKYGRDFYMIERHNGFESFVQASVVPEELQ